MYDAIVVGARCAGSSTALLLARKGYKVLLVDRSTYPSDLAFSTHYIHQSGMARLKRWGLFDRIAASNCPPITSFYFDFGAFALTGSPPPAEGVNEDPDSPLMSSSLMVIACAGFAVGQRADHL